MPHLFVSGDRFGAGINVDNQYDSALVDSIPSACFLRHEEYKAPEEWNNVRHSNRH